MKTLAIVSTKWWVLPLTLVIGTDIALAQQLNQPKRQRSVDTSAIEKQFTQQFTKLVNPQQLETKVRQSVNSVVSEDKIRKQVTDSVNQFVAPDKIESDVQNAVDAALNDAFKDLSNLKLN